MSGIDQKSSTGDAPDVCDAPSFAKSPMRRPRILQPTHNHFVMTHSELIPRRTFLIDSARIAAAGWLTLELQLLVGCARDDGHRDGFTHLTAAEGRALRAFAAQILPSDGDLPGADEAGAVYFADRAFGMPFFAASVPVIRSGLADLDARAQAHRRQDFASASSAEQIAIMRAIETTPFFVSARALVIIGTLADPSYGGNRGGAGWALLDIEHRPSYTAPFGWYDTQPVPGAPSGAE
jgi:gluconate 2-dehydrogenase gamma chain